ncbi:MAG: TraB/GumN family protein [Prevotella sp.]
MRKIIITAMTAVMAITGASAQLLYRISGKDLTKPSYVIGTHHLANVGFAEKVPGLKDALTETEQVYGELKWDDLTNPDSMRIMKESMMLKDGKTLKDVLSAEAYKKVDNYLKKTMGVGLSHPQVAAQMGKLTPAALTNQLTVLMYMQRHMGEFDPSSTFDQYFQAQAQKNNEPVGGLETISFQTGIVFNSKTIDRQAEELICLIDHEELNADLMDEMTEAFYAQNLDALKKVMDTKINDKCDPTPEESARLIDNRNADWAAKMPDIMKARPTFFAVGAGHLPGDKGLLKLLRDAGYTVEAVK